MTNVLFLMADELSWWGLGHENPRVKTPNLDALAARGLRFTSAYTPSPMCVPTRAAIATGKYVHEIGYWSSAEAYDGRVPSWGHAVQTAGKTCVSIGKLHYRNGADDTGFDQQIEPIHIPGGKGWVRGLLRKPVCSYDATAELSEMIGPGDSTYLQFDQRVAQETVNWLAEPARRTRDWVTFVSFLSPHYPLIAPQEFYDLYDPKDFESDAQDIPDHPILKEIGEFFNHDEHFTRETRGIAVASYYALCTFLDAQIGKVLAALDTNHLTDDTLIIFTSDHGEMLGEKGFWTKSVMYESSARIPLMMAGPNITPDVRDDPVSLIDIAPTIAAICGTSQRPYSGQDLRIKPKVSRTVLSEYHDGGCSVGVTMVRWNDDKGHWKYVHYAEGHAPQLFELVTDPTEQNDQKGKNAGALAEAKKRLARWMDPETINAHAHADQAKLVDNLGGRDTLLAEPQWNFTPADSR
jgi:choline-sulfatase